VINKTSMNTFKKILQLIKTIYVNILKMIQKLSNKTNYTG